MNHEVLASELIRALRGTRSQGAINRRLGRTSNVAHAWERGSRSPSASDFFKLARASKVDVGRVLRELAGGAAPALPVGTLDTRAIAAWLGALAHDRPHAELARAVSRDRNTVARWLRGASEPKLPDLLRFIEATTRRLLDFVAAFVDPSSLDSVSGVWRDLQHQRRLAYDMPWAHAVLRALELGGYRKLAAHQPGFIAARIGISAELEAECLSALARAGQIRRRHGKWALARVMTVDTRDDPEGNWRLKRHWARIGSERLERGSLPPSSQYSYNLFAISDEGLEQIRQAHLQYYERLRQIVAECEAPTRLALVNLQLLPLDT